MLPAHKFVLAFEALEKAAFIFLSGHSSEMSYSGRNQELLDRLVSCSLLSGNGPCNKQAAQGSRVSSQTMRSTAAQCGGVIDDHWLAGCAASTAERTAWHTVPAPQSTAQQTGLQKGVRTQQSCAASKPSRPSLLPGPGWPAGSMPSTLRWTGSPVHTTHAHQQAAHRPKPAGPSHVH